MTENLKKLFIELRYGMSQAITISPDREYIRPENNSFQIDNENLTNDTRTIGRNLKVKLNKCSNGESSKNR